MKDISPFDWPDTVSRTDKHTYETAPDFTPKNFLYLIDRFNDLASEVRQLREQAGLGSIDE